MSIAEIKAKLAELSAEEKRELARFLEESVKADAAARARRTDELMRGMDDGRKFSREDLERLDRGLSASNL